MNSKHDVLAKPGGNRWHHRRAADHHSAPPRHAHEATGTRLGGLQLLGVLVTLALSAATVATANDNIIHVNCNAGKTLKKALGKADPGDTIRVTGTCTERVTITTDRITLNGGGSAVLDGGGGTSTAFDAVVNINGARGVTIKGFTIQHSPGSGILGGSGAAFTVKDTTMQDNGAAGLFLNSSSVEVTDVVVQRSGQSSGGIGIAVQNNSTAVFRGNVSSTESGSNGIAVQSGSTLEIRGASVHASNNGGGGVDIVDSQVIIFGYPESQGSTLTAHNNGRGGIFVATGSLSFFGGSAAFAGTGTLATISASHNGGSGIEIGPNGVIVSPFAAAKIISEYNDTGLNLNEGGSALLFGGLTVQKNKIGLLGDGAGTLTLASFPPDAPSAITGNDTDVDLRFGTRVTFGGVTIGTIVCDATVLSRGTTVCP